MQSLAKVCDDSSEPGIIELTLPQCLPQLTLAYVRSRDVSLHVDNFCLHIAVNKSTKVDKNTEKLNFEQSSTKTLQYFQIFTKFFSLPFQETCKSSSILKFQKIPIL